MSRLYHTQAIDQFTESNRQIRNRLRLHRRQLPLSQVQLNSDRVAAFLKHRLKVDELHCIAGYLANEGEICLESLFDWFHELEVRLVVPYEQKGEIKFTGLTADDVLVMGKWGIRTPKLTSDFPLEEIDVVLTPLVAFSSRGERLGRGGGFYDRAFAHSKRPVMLGIAHEFQLNDGIHTSTTDIPLDAVVTEVGWRNFNPRIQNFLRED